MSPKQDEVHEGVPAKEGNETSDPETGHSDPEGTYAEDASRQGKKPTLISKESSILPSSDDPFAPREGKTLLWRNVNMILVSKLYALLYTDDAEFCLNDLTP